MEPWPKYVQSDLLVIGFIRFYVSLGDLVLPYLLYFSSLYLILSYYTMRFFTGCHLLYPSCSCMHVLTNTIFYACLCLGFIDTHVLIYARHLAFASPLAGEFWLLWILMSRFQSLQRVDSPCCWPEKRRVAWISGRPSRAPTFQVPLLGSRGFPVMTLSRHLYCSYLYILVFLHLCHIGDVILL